MENSFLSSCLVVMLVAQGASITGLMPGNLVSNGWWVAMLVHAVKNFLLFEIPLGQFKKVSCLCQDLAGRHRDTVFP